MDKKQKNSKKYCKQVRCANIKPRQMETFYQTRIRPVLKRIFRICSKCFAVFAKQRQAKADVLAKRLREMKGRNNMKKTMRFALAAAALCATMAGSTALADTTITFWDGNWNEASFEKIQELWNKENPDIKIEAEFLVDNGMSDKYMLALQNGTAADVVACALDWTTTFGNAGLLAPLDDYAAADGVRSESVCAGRDQCLYRERQAVCASVPQRDVCPLLQ